MEAEHTAINWDQVLLYDTPDFPHGARPGGLCLCGRYAHFGPRALRCQTAGACPESDACDAYAYVALKRRQQKKRPISDVCNATFACGPMRDGRTSAPTLDETVER
jgi:hypothetical protein